MSFDVEIIIPDTKIPRTAYYAFKQSYFKGDHPHERFGQAFINKYLREKPICFPKLFHEANIVQAALIIQELFIDWSDE